MKATSQAPTQEGWYWWKLDESDKNDWLMMQVVNDSRNGLVVLSHTMKQIAPVSNMVGFWARVPKPSLPTKKEKSR